MKHVHFRIWLLGILAMFFVSCGGSTQISPPNTTTTPNTDPAPPSTTPSTPDPDIRTGNIGVLPTVNLRANTKSIYANTNLTLTAEIDTLASDPNVVIDHVEFTSYRNGITTNLGSDSSSPYSNSRNVTNADNGSFKYQAIVFTKAHGNITSNQIIVGINIF